MRGPLVYILIFIAILAVVFYSPFTPYLLKDFLTYKLEKALDMNIVFGKASLKFPVRLLMSDVKAIDKAGPALIAEKATFKLIPSEIIRAKIVLNCDLENVNLKSKLSGSLNDLLKTVGVPAQDGYKFDTVKGVVTIKAGVVSIKDLNASGPDFRFTGNFAKFNDKKVDYDFEFKVNKRVVTAQGGKKNLFLVGEGEDGWYPVKFSLKGDPHKPSSVSFSTGGIKLQVQSSGQ